jgi:peptidoglycan hydrolase-like protein with peptidoglycan-binding domain
MTPATRRAVWNFQKAKGLAPTARFDPETMAALAPAEPTGTARTPEPQPSALPRSNGFGGNGFGASPGFARPSSDFQAP